MNSWRVTLDGLALDSGSMAMRRLYSQTLRVWASLALFTISAAALNPSRQISQYAHTAWRIQDGFFSGTPQAITQTADGYLWIGTEGGLVRFDGVRFLPWVAPNGERLPSSRIHSLLGARDGSLWIGTSRGLAKWNNQELTSISGESSFIEAILEDPQGRVWVTRSQVHDHGGPLCEVTGNTLQCHGTSERISFPFAQPLFRDASGNLWIGSALGVCRWKAGDAETFLAKALRGGDLLAGVSAIASGADGSLLVGMRRTGTGLGLQQLLQGHWKDYSLPELSGTKLGVAALLRDHADGLWIGTTNRGIYRVQGDKEDHFDSSDGLSSDSVQGFYEDREGDLWVATSRGIDRFHETRVLSFSIREGLTSEDADSVFAAHDGTIWIGNVQALDVLRHGKLSSIRARDGLPGRLVTSLLEDHQGRLWVGIDNGLSIYEAGHFRPLNKPDGKPLGIVVAMTEDVAHNIWVAVTEPALYRIQDLQIREELVAPRIPRVSALAADPVDGVWLGLASGILAQYKRGQLEPLPTHRPVNHSVRNLFVEPGVGTWGATSDGAFLWSEGREQMLDSHNGLGCDDVYTVLKDRRGSLWLDTQCGFVVISGSELKLWWEHPDAKLSVTTLDVFDGAQPGLTNFRPEASISPDGKLWFANQNILQMVDPEHLKGNGVPPPVQIEQIIADRKKYLPHEKLQLPVRTRDIEIDYTALSFVAPPKVHFRYKLEGHDSDWQDPENRRQAFYTDLPPGNYRFHVIASNNDGVWNEAGAAVSFAVLPAFFQTAWFRICCILAAAEILALLYVIRLRRLAATMQARFEERLKVRERIARDLHDTLLQGIYSASIQFELANNRLSEDSPAKPVLQRGVDLLRQVSQEGRKALRSLRSQPTLDRLEQALSLLPKEFALPENVEFLVVTDGRYRVLRRVIRDQAYLIAREAAINAFRHARASKIEVDVHYSSRGFRLLVRDNGCGIDDHVLKTGREGHWGLAGMRERTEKIGGKLEVLSRVNAGTEIQLWVPGRLAFQSASTRRSWKWLTWFYPEKGQKNSPASSEEQHE